MLNVLRPINPINPMNHTAEHQSMFIKKQTPMGPGTAGLEMLCPVASCDCVSSRTLRTELDKVKKELEQSMLTITILRNAYDNLSQEYMGLERSGIRKDNQVTKLQTQMRSYYNYQFNSIQNMRDSFVTQMKQKEEITRLQDTIQTLTLQTPQHPQHVPTPQGPTPQGPLYLRDTEVPPPPKKAPPMAPRQPPKDMNAMNIREFLNCFCVCNSFDEICSMAKQIGVSAPIVEPMAKHITFMGFRMKCKGKTEKNNKRNWAKRFVRKYGEELVGDIIAAENAKIDNQIADFGEQQNETNEESLDSSQYIKLKSYILMNCTDSTDGSIDQDDEDEKENVANGLHNLAQRWSVSPPEFKISKVSQDTFQIEMHFLDRVARAGSDESPNPELKSNVCDSYIRQFGRIVCSEFEIRV